MRRFAKQGAVLAGVAFVAACGPKAKVLTDSEAASERAACTFQAGALPSSTLATDVPQGSKIPIDHIILIMQENRSFDHYFSLLPGVDGAPATGVTNPGPNGVPVPRYHTSTYCIQDDVNHSWDGVATELDNGKMDGFAIANEDPDAGDPTGARAMGYLTSKDLPFYYSLAGTFAISDRHFCSAPGDTAPNREYYAAATTRGAVDENDLNIPQTDAKGNQLDDIYSLLQKSGVDWNFYAGPGGTPQQGSFAIMNEAFAEQFAGEKGFKSLGDFYADLKAGTLPSVSFVDEATDDTETCLGNEHPTEDPQRGQKFISNVVSALFASPDWKTSALFITWDEHGGFYDHVYPPPACEPDDYPPVTYVNGVLTPQPGAFNIYGPRVPLILVSPFAKRKYVSHEVTDHTSLLRFVEARFGLPALTRRDANAEPPYDMFDFDHPDYSTPTLQPALMDDAAESIAHSCSPFAATCTFGENPD